MSIIKVVKEFSRRKLELKDVKLMSFAVISLEMSYDDQLNSIALTIIVKSKTKDYFYALDSVLEMEEFEHLLANVSTSKDAIDVVVREIIKKSKISFESTGCNMIMSLTLGDFESCCSVDGLQCRHWSQLSSMRKKAICAGILRRSDSYTDENEMLGGTRPLTEDDARRILSDID